MRKILFRGKDSDGNWQYGFYVITVNYSWIITIDEKSNETWHPISPETVGQFTGLCDKNGKKIFEGDILKHPNSKGVLIVVFDLGCFMLQYVDNYLKKNSVYVSIGHSEFCKIIGNIYDNPELVK